jgi:hypothetical protein
MASGPLSSLIRLEDRPVRSIETNAEDAGNALRAVLQLMDLEPERKLALFPEPKECVTCSVALQYGDLRDRYVQAARFRELTEAQAAALMRVEEAAPLAGSLPDHCHEPLEWRRPPRIDRNQSRPYGGGGSGPIGSQGRAAAYSYFF